MSPVRREAAIDDLGLSRFQPPEDVEGGARRLHEVDRPVEATRGLHRVPDGKARQHLLGQPEKGGTKLFGGHGATEREATIVSARTPDEGGDTRRHDLDVAQNIARRE